MTDLPTPALPLHASLAPSAHVHAARELTGDPNQRQYVPLARASALERDLPTWFIAAVLVGWSLLAAARVVWFVGAEVRGERELLDALHARSPERR